ncbi:MAG: hypothetical protein AB7O67_07515 [Vicinamibacterales bacterium]
MNLLDCVLSLNRRYEAFTRPRVQAFANRRRVSTMRGLISLMISYDSLRSFGVQELDYNDPARMETLLGVARYLHRVQAHYTGASEMARLRKWARAAGPDTLAEIGVNGFGLAGFQYLRMLLGVQTAKPDVHIRNFVRDAVARDVSDVEALRLLEAAAAKGRLKVRDVDSHVWTVRSQRKARPATAV